MQDDVAKDYGQSWYAATAVEAPERPPLAADLDVDACVIGGGLAGLTAARELARFGWSVVVLEQKRIAWNASGRNCGFVLPGYGAGITGIIARVGLDQAKHLWALSEAGVEYVRAAIRESDMPGVQLRRGWLEVSKTDDGAETEALAETLGHDFGATVEAWRTERVREVLHSDHYFNALHFPRAFAIHPLNYALGLARAAETAGARICEQTPALQIDPAGVRKRILTPGGLVRAGHVVLAGNIHLGSLMPQLSATLLPLTSYAMVTEPVGSRLADAIAYQGAISDTVTANYHYRIVDGDRLLWAGGGAPFQRNPHKMAQSFCRAIAQIYPQLGELKVAQAWGGIMGFTVHRMPQIGEISPGLWVASGFGGHGLNTTAIAGNLIARAIADNDDNWRSFIPYELVWAGGVFGRLYGEVRSHLRDWQENLAAKRARQRAQQHPVARSEPELAAAPRWDEARAVSEQAVADARADEAYDARGLPLPSFDRLRRRRLPPTAEDEVPPAPAEDLDWRQAKAAGDRDPA